MPGKIRWGILSTAGIARQHVIGAIHESHNGEVLAISSRDAERAERVARRFGIPRAYGSYDELLADDDVDAVYNPLPVALHAEWSIRCAAAGKPCLCEKPMAANAEEAEHMVDTFARRGLLLAEALMYRHHPLTKKVKQLVDDGEIGRVRVVQSVFCALCPGEDNIRWRPELGGGAMRDVGCYCVSLTRLLTGEEPATVTADARFGETGVDEWLAGTLRFPSGARGSFACGLGMEFGCQYDVYGTEGRILVDRGVVPGADSPAVIRLYRHYDCREITVPPANHYRLMVEDFADALLNDRPPAVPPEDAVANMQVVDRLLAAARTR